MFKPFINAYKSFYSLEVPLKLKMKNTWLILLSHFILSHFAQNMGLYLLYRYHTTNMATFLVLIHPVAISVTGGLKQALSYYFLPENSQRKRWHFFRRELHMFFENFHRIDFESRSKDLRQNLKR